MQFEGEKVDDYSMTIRQAKLPIGKPFARGEVTTITLEVEVQEVSHRENLRTGEIIRDHVVKVKEVK